LGYPCDGMRCPSCGTENAPDSRFCGGCGARLTQTESRVAPTHKISDDARYPIYSSTPPPAAPAPQVHVPMAMPAPVVPYNGAAIARAATDPSEPPAPARRPTPVPVAAPRGSSVALPAQGRRWGLVLAILVVDLGLAGAGVVLLTQGLRDDAAHPSTPVAPGPAPGPAPSPAPVKASAAEPAKPPGAPVMVVSKAVVKVVKPTAPPAKVATKSPKKPTKNAAAPVDPYAAPDPPPAAPPPLQDDDDHSAAISDAIDAKSTRAESVFSRCYTQATKPLPADQPLRGRIQIAFTVLTNGHVDHVTTAENQTGSDQLANCLASEIGGWIFAEHPQDPMEITKIFAFGPSSS